MARLPIAWRVPGVRTSCDSFPAESLSRCSRNDRGVNAVVSVDDADREIVAARVTPSRGTNVPMKAANREDMQKGTLTWSI